MSAHTLEMFIPKKGGAEVLQARDRDLPLPVSGEAQVVIEAAGVAYADIAVRNGLYSGQKPPVVPGYDFVGRIEALGPNAGGFSIGQRVAGVTIVGSYATRRNVPLAWLVPAPEGTSAAKLVAATLNGVTAWQMFHRLANPAPGEWVLVHGAAGGVGSMLIDIARLAGVNAIGSASVGKHADIIARGAVPIDYAKGGVAARAREISNGGVVAAFDHVGGRHFRDESIAAIRTGGIGIMYGAYNTTRDGKTNMLAIVDLMLGPKFAAFKLFRRSQSLATYAIPAWRDSRPEAYRADLMRVLALVGEGKLVPLVGGTFPLRQADEAQRALENRAIAGKIVLVP